MGFWCDDILHTAFKWINLRKTIRISTIFIASWYPVSIIGNQCVISHAIIACLIRTTVVKYSNSISFFDESPKCIHVSQSVVFYSNKTVLFHSNKTKILSLQFIKEKSIEENGEKFGHSSARRILAISSSFNRLQSKSIQGQTTTYSNFQHRTSNWHCNVSVFTDNNNCRVRSPLPG